MNAVQLEQWILDTYPGIVVSDAYGERSFFYNPEQHLPKGVYFATIKENDGPNDKASCLDREGAYRLSIGVGKESYHHLFGDVPARPRKGGVVRADVDFAAMGVLMPHPIYAWLGWICINNPDDTSLHHVKMLLDLSYEKVLVKYAKAIAAMVPAPPR